MLPPLRLQMKMRARIGVDLVQISKMAELMEDEAFLRRVFHPPELLDRRPERLAGVFAAKEALFKALGTTRLWLEAEVGWDAAGRPELRVAGEAVPAGLLSLDLSITHEGEYAVAAVVVLLSEEETNGSQNPI